MELVQGQLVGGKYRLDRMLARGGMGVVWIARHHQLQHEVAIKFLDASYAASAAIRARFEREAMAAANLRSPHIVQVHDYGVEDGSPYLVMELLAGEDLGARLSRVGRLGFVEALRILSQVAKGLRKAHDAGIIHRDLKPGNLFLAAGDDGEEVVKIVDFGIAKETGVKLVGEATRTGEVMGSPHYMSPEQVRGEREIDPRSDLWSLGVILFRCVTGHLPFPGDILTAVVMKIMVEPIPPPSAVLPGLPPAVDAFFARALARDKNQRFQSVAEMLTAFGQLSNIEVGPARHGEIAALSTIGSNPSLSGSGVSAYSTGQAVSGTTGGLAASAPSMAVAGGAPGAARRSPAGAVAAILGALLLGGGAVFAWLFFLRGDEGAAAQSAAAESGGSASPTATAPPSVTPAPASAASSGASGDEPAAPPATSQAAPGPPPRPTVPAPKPTVPAPRPTVPAPKPTAPHPKPPVKTPVNTID